MMLIFVPGSQQKEGAELPDDKWAEYYRIYIVAEHIHTLQVISQY